MDTSRSHLWLYDAARQAIKDAASGAATETAGRYPEICATPPPQDDLLGHKLDRLVRESYSRRRGKHETPGKQQILPDGGGSGGGKRQRREGEESPAGIAPTANVDEDASDRADALGGEEGHATTQVDECLGLMAEAFADDLDLLRRDEHFGGSAKDIAAMANMMRGIASGMDGTEQIMFLDNATR